MIRIKYSRALNLLPFSILMPISTVFANATSPQWEETPEALKEPGLFTLQEVIDEKALPVEKEAEQALRPTGASCLILEESKTLESGKDVFDWNPETDEKTLLLSAESMVPEGQEQPLYLANQRNLIWSPDETKLLIYTNTKRVWRVNSRGDYWVLDLETKTLDQLGPNFEPSTLMFAKFSPDSKRVAYVQD